MSKILKVRNVNDYSRYIGCADQHPLVSVIDYAEVSPVRHSLNDYGVYGIFFHDEAEIDLAYGCGKYDYKKGTVICVAPGQIGGKEDNGELVMLTGWALLFHPDLLHGFPLEKHIKEYSFFDYRINEALHMTDEEHDILASLMRQIREELEKKPDELQNAILVGYIELALDFCQRFYNRQFVTRKIENSDILVRFDRLLRDYFEDKLQLTLGLPTVQYCADKLCMSANYFGDVIKKTTGDTASNHIRQFVIQLAKNGLAAGETVSQVSDRLGFEYPQHFSRMFSASNIPSISAGCSRSRRALRRRNTSERCDCDAQGHLSSVAFPSNSRSASHAGNGKVSSSSAPCAFSISTYSGMMMWVWTSIVCPQRGTEPRDIPANNKVSNLISPTGYILHRLQAPAIHWTCFLLEPQKRDAQTNCPPPPHASASHLPGCG